MSNTIKADMDHYELLVDLTLEVEDAHEMLFTVFRECCEYLSVHEGGSHIEEPGAKYVVPSRLTTHIMERLRITAELFGDEVRRLALAGVKAYQTFNDVFSTTERTARAQLPMAADMGRVMEEVWRRSRQRRQLRLN